jgi:predicted transposase/invertase (TIGR01784 family)
MMLKARNPEVGQAINRLMKLSEDEEARMIAESREKLQRDILSIRYAAKREGQEETQRTVARKALAEGLPLGTVMAITGLSQTDLLLLQPEGQTRH